MKETKLNKLIEEIFFIFDLAIYKSHKKRQIKALLKEDKKYLMNKNKNIILSNTYGWKNAK